MQIMIDTCNIQKNVDMTIKDELKRINELVDLITKDHSLAKKVLVISGEGQDTKKIYEGARGIRLR